MQLLLTSKLRAFLRFKAAVSGLPRISAFSKLEHEIVRKTACVSFQLLIQALGWDAIEFGSAFGIQHQAQPNKPTHYLNIT
jgi:hypothetical protein